MCIQNEKLYGAKANMLGMSKGLVRRVDVGIGTYGRRIQTAESRPYCVDCAVLLLRKEIPKALAVLLVKFGEMLQIRIEFPF